MNPARAKRAGATLSAGIPQTPNKSNSNWEVKSQKCSQERRTSAMWKNDIRLPCSSWFCSVGSPASPFRAASYSHHHIQHILTGLQPLRHAVRTPRSHHQLLKESIVPRLAEGLALPFAKPDGVFVESLAFRPVGNGFCVFEVVGCNSC